ncbi:Initiation-specific alpha-1,6-mannosyltransferase [Madurella mycetomatis]|uniref:Initiation-specific alpha-1,6-mannosyltransferase n=1 Tax=Madurella mycetomatis TaxID=100816 RepID=A0A175WEB3_9PEZI|nr:Initiation-specific alpha-1,6-mannosyltransferase [Madurella mycetomatis]KXX81254.1 Initiation-specific alpha-1,6-mannosyltransferase [Madurella mycetomatis]
MIWQSWKLYPLSFEKRDFDTARTWTTKNPDYRYEVLTDNNNIVYVEEKFGPHGFNHPDIIDFYHSVNAIIIKADLLRYIAMYAEGGVCADIDVEMLKPIGRFIPIRYSPADIDMVVGWESTTLIPRPPNPQPEVNEFSPVNLYEQTPATCNDAAH